MELKETSHQFLSEALNNVIQNYKFCKDDLFVVAAGNFGRSYGVSYTEIGTLENLLGNLIK